MRLYWTLDSEEFGGLIPEELLERIKIWTKAMFEEASKVFERGQQERIILDYSPELLMHLMSAVNKGIFIHTNKENRFNIANIDSDDLYRTVIKMMNAMFASSQKLMSAGMAK